MSETRTDIRRYLQSSGFTNDLLIGMADGIMLPFALALAMSLITHNSLLVLLACVIESVLLAILFGIAAYQTVVNQAEEYPEEGAQPSGLPRKTFVSHLRLQQILSGLDMETDVIEKAAEEGVSYKERWSSMLAAYDLGMPLPDLRKARRNAFNVALTFFAGGLLPLLPYIFMGKPLQALKLSALITFVCLAVLGGLKASYTGQTPWKGALRLVLTGLIVALAAFLAAWLIG